ncbi:MAG: hypothetical protein U0326_27625 [Polyangiales bacterium]
MKPPLRNGVATSSATDPSSSHDAVGSIGSGAGAGLGSGPHALDATTTAQSITTARDITPRS